MIKFKCPLIVVDNIDVSRDFYENVLEQKVKYDFGENVMYQGDFSIQLKAHFANMITINQEDIVNKSNSFELYFEEENLDEFIERLKDYKEIDYIHTLIEHPWGQRVVRFYDPDMNIIEVGESMESVAKRFLSEGLSVEETAKRTQHPIEFIRNITMGFDDYAKTWDTDKRINRAKVIAKEISNSIDTNKNYSAMEFGCGTGLVSFNLCDRFRSIALVDSSKGMIDVLNTKIYKYGVTNMTPYLLDISTGNCLDMKFDVIYSSMVLHHIHDIEAMINILYKLLNKDGYLCIVDLDEEDGSFHKKYPEFDGHNGFNQAVLKNILSLSGFKNIEANTFFYDEKVIEDEKIKYSLFLMKGRKQ